MKLDFLKKIKEKKPKEEGDKKKLNIIVIWIIIIAIACLAASSLFGSDKNESGSTENSKNKYETKKEENPGNDYEYVDLMEGKLKATVEKIQGAGEVSVMITVKNSGSSVLAKNEKSSVTTKESGDNETEDGQSEERSVVLAGQGSSSAPIVVEQTVPEITGVLVVAKGAVDEKIRYEIFEAVKALYGLSANRIKVTY